MEEDVKGRRKEKQKTAAWRPEAINASEMSETNSEPEEKHSFLDNFPLQNFREKRKN